MDDNCAICDKEFEEGERVYLTGGGTFMKEHYGPIADGEEPFYTVACTDCGLKISTAISKLYGGG